MEYQLGPLQIRPEAWPQAWTSCAEKWLSRANGDHDVAAVTVAFAGHGLSGPDAVQATCVEDLLTGTRRGPAQWELRGGGLFIARLEEQGRLVEIRVRSMDDDAGLVLGNALRGLAATSLPTYANGLMIHACAGILDGHGVLAAGVSTAGKSTLALGFVHTEYVSDDVALVVNVGSSPILAPSPFFGTVGRRGTDASAPLRAIGILVDKVSEPDARSTYQRVPRTRGAAELIRHVARFTTDRELSARLLDLTVALTERIPVVLVRRSLLDPSDDVIRGILKEAGC